MLTHKTPWVTTPRHTSYTPFLVSRMCALLLCQPLTVPYLPTPDTPHVTPSLTPSNKIWVFFCTSMSTPDTLSLSHHWHIPCRSGLLLYRPQALSGLHTPGTPYVTPSLTRSNKLCSSGLLRRRPPTLAHRHTLGTPHVTTSSTIIWFIWLATVLTHDTPTLTPLAHLMSLPS